MRPKKGQVLWLRWAFADYKGFPVKIVSKVYTDRSITVRSPFTDEWQDYYCAPGDGQVHLAWVRRGDAPECQLVIWADHFLYARYGDELGCPRTFLQTIPEDLPDDIRAYVGDSPLPHHMTRALLSQVRMRLAHRVDVRAGEVWDMRERGCVYLFSLTNCRGAWMDWVGEPSAQSVLREQRDTYGSDVEYLPLFGPSELLMAVNTTLERNYLCDEPVPDLPGFVRCRATLEYRADKWWYTEKQCKHLMTK